MSLWSKVQTGAKKAAGQTTNFLQESSTLAVSQASGVKQNFSLAAETQKAAEILTVFLADPNQPRSALNAIPKAVLLNAKGLAIFTVVKAGFIFSGRGGTGLVISRLPDGSWSAPSLIGTGGLGWGLQAGADITVLNSDEAVRSFSMGGNVTIGGNISAAAGPIGTGGSVQTALASPAAMFSYSKSKGLFAGLSLEGTVLIERKEANKQFYGSAVPSRDILSGKVPAPEIASRMYEVIEAAEGIDESSIPQEAYVPTAMGGHVPVNESSLRAGAPGAGSGPTSTGLGNEKGSKSNVVFDSGETGK
ncbi:Uncharacterized conserved protein [Phaffia rhodozyma]|uniref:Uncharacterized conserved protein n=1 Tax=Phaffia rhodozyma TaxID=264483 RepID=A0A0F7SRA3_PHARH|nr:Uncharacterized conserved protein [Phaffia rhodozyma]